MMTPAATSGPLPGFATEPYLDFSKPETQAAANAAFARVRSEFGREYDAWIGGARHKTGDLLDSLNPSDPSEIVGRHHRASADLAKRAIDDAHAYFPGGAGTPVERRIALLRASRRAYSRTETRVRCLAGVRSGQDMARSGSRCFRSHRFLRVLCAPDAANGSPDPLVQMPGERDEMVYLPLGAGMIIPPWNFPLAIMAGMSVAALVTGNTVVIKPSSETPTIAAEVRGSAAGRRLSTA